MAHFGVPEALVALLAMGVVALWLWALVDCIRNEPTSIDKLLWVFVILAFNVLGAVVYLVVRRGRRSAGGRPA